MSQPDDDHGIETCSCMSTLSSVQWLFV